MSFTETFVRRPVLSSVVSLLILLLGLQGMVNLQLREYPEVKETTITITTVYVGASADLIQGFITTPIAKLKPRKLALIWLNRHSNDR